MTTFSFILFPIMTGDREVSYRPIFFPVCPGSSNSPISLCETLLGQVFFQFLKWRIHFFYIDHNAPSLFPPPTHPPPPQYLYNRCFQFLRGITVVPREIQDNGYSKFGGLNTVHYGLCENGQWGQC